MSRRRWYPNRLREATIKANVARRGRDARPVLPFETDLFTRRVLRPALIALLALAIGLAILVVVEISTPGLPWFTLVPLVFLIALEGTYTAAWIRNPESHGVDKGTYRAAEVFVIIVLCRVYSWFALGGGIPGRVEFLEYLRHPLEFFALGGFITTTVVVLVAWGFAGYISRLFNDLDLSPYELRFYTMPAAEQKAQADNRPIQISRESLQTQYTRAWLIGGMVLVAIAALSTYEVREFATVASVLDITRLGLRPAMLTSLLIYFLIGFWLQSHARLLRLNARWLSQGVTKDAVIDRRWQRTSLLLVLLIALAATFLPIGSSPLISQIIGGALTGILYVISLAFSALAYLMSALLALFNQAPAEGPPPTLAPLPTPEYAPPPTPAPPSDTFAFLASSAFWTVLVMITIFAAMYFWRERGYTLNRERAAGIWAKARAWLRSLWLALTGRMREAGDALRERLSAAPEPGEPAPPTALPSWRFVRVNGLPPREQIRYFYLSAVRRAGEQGVRRQNGETPLEYVEDLKATWPEAEADLQQLTEAFLEARYAAHPIEPDEVSPIKAYWKRVKAALRTGPSGKSGDN